MSFVISIDGDSGTGKGTLAKNIAKHYDCNFLPTGNMYRHIAKKCIEGNISLTEEEQILKIAQSISVEAIHDSSLRDDSIGKTASLIAQNQKIRNTLDDFQRSWCKKQKIAVIEGRDIGTKICPNADVKLYLTADPKIVAKRRYKEFLDMNISISEEQIYRDLLERNLRDAKREHSPTAQPEDAHVINTTNLTISEVLEKTLTIVENKLTIR